MRAEVEQGRMEAVWRERAARLSRRSAAAEDGQDLRPVMVLGIGAERYAVELRHVEEVLPPVRATPVPGVAAMFAGVINVHGEIRPVVDLRRLLGMDAVPISDRPRVIVLGKEGRKMGLQIDSVEQIRWIGSRDLEAAGNSGRSRYITGSTKDLLMLINTEGLFAELQIGVAS
jgi:purine-binding chemotaxis protein CheW